MYEVVCAGDMAKSSRACGITKTIKQFEDNIKMGIKLIVIELAQDFV